MTPPKYLTVDHFRAGTAAALLDFAKAHGLTPEYNPPGITTGYAARLPRSGRARKRTLAALDQANADYLTTT